MFSQAMAEMKKLRLDEEKRSGKPHCDHSNAYTGTFQWNGLTYCNCCCEHNFGHINFTMHPANGGPGICTKCWTVVGPDIISDWTVEGLNINGGYHPKPIKRKLSKLNTPKIVLTNCKGEDTHITRIYTKRK